MITEKFHKLLINRQTNINLPFLFCFDESAHRELKEGEEGGIVQKGAHYQIVLRTFIII